VRQIYRQLKRKKDRAAAERDRLERMLEIEKRLWSSGLLYVAGVDEAGVGPLAGPVVAAAVIFAPDKRIQGVDDSKSIDPVQREKLAEEISREALAVAVGISEVDEIDRVNIYNAGLAAMRRAVSRLSIHPQHVLVDGRKVPGIEIPQDKLIRGDRRSFAVAAASIIAKTRRDTLMGLLDAKYPGYGFAQHKGYATSAHRDALRRLGPAPPHRRSFTLFQNRQPGLFDQIEE
jgi:ribonuclease HII